MRQTAESRPVALTSRGERDRAAQRVSKAITKHLQNARNETSPSPA
jgi:hypothetical protein